MKSIKTGSTSIVCFNRCRSKKKGEGGEDMKKEVTCDKRELRGSIWAQMDTG